MSEESILYGRINGAPGTLENWYDLYKINKDIIENLPDNENWPPIVKGLFSVPETIPSPTFHRAQIIHFGASFKNFNDKDLRDWLSKFEDLLKKMYWWDVILHFDIELYGKYKYIWTATDDAIKKMRTLNPKPVTDWEYIEEQIN
jgi:hypothetical protein